MRLASFELSDYEKERDFKRVAHWLEARGKAHLAETLPHYGRVIFFEGQAIAAGFLRMVEGSIALFDSLTTNPEALPTIRNEALDLLVTDLLKQAKTLGIQTLLAFSSDAHTLIRSEKHGFQKQDHCVISQSLGRKG